MQIKEESVNEVGDEPSTTTELTIVPSQAPKTTSTEPTPTGRRAPGRPRLMRTGNRGRPRKEYRTISDGGADGIPLIDPGDDLFAGHAEISMTEAMSGDNRDEWEDAILAEITSLVSTDTWEIVKKPEGANVVGSRFVLTNKYGTGGIIERKKARLVAKGFSQRYGIDYHHTFTPVERLETIRLVCALAVELKLNIHQVDITAAYLNGYLEEEAFMKIPDRLPEVLNRLIQREGTNDLGKRAAVMLSNMKTNCDVCKLKRSLHGLKQAERQWHERLKQKFTGMGPIGCQARTMPVLYH